MNHSTDHSADYSSTRAGRLAEQVDRQGHVVVTTGTAPGETPYAYTVGRSALGRPELLVTGLQDANVATTLLNALAEYDDVTPLNGGEVIQPDQVVSSHSSTVVAADPVTANMKAASLFADARGLEVTALQLLWPDVHGNLPGTELYDDESTNQPIYPSQRTGQ